MRIQSLRLGKPLVLLTLSILGLVASASFSIRPSEATGFPTPGSPATVPMGTTLLTDSNIRFSDAAPAPGTALASDPKVKLVDTNFDGHWDTGETVVYDTNNNGQYDYGEPAIGGKLPTIGQSLIFDSKIKFVDTNLNGVWDPGETVVYEKSGASSYALGDPVISGNPPNVGGTLGFDSKVKYVDSGNLNHWVSGDSVVYDSNNTGRYANNTDIHIKYLDSNSNGHWDPGESVAYDANLNGRYDSGETVLYGTPPSLGASLKFDKLIKFLDPGNRGIWVQGDAIVYDSNNDNLYESGEPVIANSSPSTGTVLSTDPRISYVDSNSNNHWDVGESVIYDSNSNGYFNASLDPQVIYYDANGNSRWDQGETVVYDTNNNQMFDHLSDKVINGTVLPDGTPLRLDSHVRIVDSNLNGHWDSGEPVLYDGNSNNVYDVTDVIISAGTPGSLVLGQVLTEPVLAGSTPAIGTGVKVDPKMKYVESNGNTVWDPGEAIVYDNNIDNAYDSGDSAILGSPPSPGSLLRAPVIAGSVPPFNTLLKIDPKIRIVSNGVWSPGTSVVYDSNSNNLYDVGEPIVAGGAPPDGVWDQGEPVVYDSDSTTNNTYASTDPIINGTAPLPGTVIRADYHIRFVDPSGTGHWISGDTVIYDSNNNNLYDTGETVIAGTAPSPLAVLQPTAAMDPLGRIWISWNEKPYGSTKGTQVFFKMWNGTSWTNKQQVTSDPTNVVDNSNFVLSLSNQTMMIFWSSNKTGHPVLFYRSYYAGVANPYPTSNSVQLTSSIYSDRAPSAATDRYGRLWVTWARQNTTQTGCFLICSNIYYKYYNGTSWSFDFPLPPAANPSLSEITPAIGRSNDGKIWIFWATNNAGTYNLYYATTDGTIQTLPATGIPAISWSSNPNFVSEGTDIDEPSMAQSRDGSLWVFYQSNDPTFPQQYIHYVNSTDGRSWNGPFSLTSGPVNDASPTAVQMTDHRIWVFWDRATNLSQIVYTTSSQITGVYHLGISRVALSPRLVRSGWSVLINVTVTNYGDFGETGLLTLRLNSTLVESTNQSFAAGTSYLLQYNWTSRVGFWGRYYVNATLRPAVAESIGNSGDENWSAGFLRIAPPGDVDGNGRVDIIDAANLAIVYGKPAINYPYDDVDRDATPGSTIDILDAATLAFYYGYSV